MHIIFRNDGEDQGTPEDASKDDPDDGVWRQRVCYESVRARERRTTRTRQVHVRRDENWL